MSITTSKTKQGITIRALKGKDAKKMKEQALSKSPRHLKNNKK